MTAVYSREICQKSAAKTHVIEPCGKKLKNKNNNRSESLFPVKREELPIILHVAKLYRVQIHIFNKNLTQAWVKTSSEKFKDSLPDFSQHEDTIILG
jgi:hypothetical protein